MNDPPDDVRNLAILKSAVETANEAFVTIDEDHQVLFFNKAAEQVFGHSRHDVVGHDLMVIMSPDCSRDHRRAVKNYIKTSVPTRIGHDTEIMAVRKNGEWFPANISFSVSEVAGRLYFTALVRDLTTTKALQEQVMKSERLAALGQLVAEITHEIKNPLMMIGGFARQLAAAEREKKRLKKLHIIEEEVLRLEGLLEQLRAFYGPRALKFERTDIKALIETVLLLVKEDCETRNIGIDFHTDGKPAIVQGDKDQLKQVFLNLFKNSVEAVDTNGTLVIRSEVSGDQVDITITDDGCGIPKKDHERIFSPFYTTKRHGSGLGLSVSKRIIEEHPGSSFALESEPGQGTTFRITMPALRE
jgi:PAS domain S-box-containing protein